MVADTLDGAELWRGTAGAESGLLVAAGRDGTLPRLLCDVAAGAALRVDDRARDRGSLERGRKCGTDRERSHGVSRQFPPVLADLGSRRAVGRVVGDGAGAGIWSWLGSDDARRNGGGGRDAVFQPADRSERPPVGGILFSRTLARTDAGGLVRALPSESSAHADVTRHLFLFDVLDSFSRVLCLGRGMAARDPHQTGIFSGTAGGELVDRADRVVVLETDGGSEPAIRPRAGPSCAGKARDVAMILVSHASGNTFVRALLASALAEHQLGRFATGFGFAHEPWFMPGLSASLRKEIGRRRYDLPAELLYTRPTRELTRLVAQRAGWTSLLRQEHGWASVDAVYQDLDRAVARRLPAWKKKHGLTAAYAYEDGALHTLRAAREEGMLAVYDLPIAYWETLRTLLREEAQRLPQWEPTLQGGTRDSEQKIARKTAELEAADLIVCPSQFVLETLPENARRKKRCIVAEFGTPEIVVPPRQKRTSAGKLRVLFAGSMSQRKGLGDLFAAMKSLRRSDVELVVMGSPQAPMSFYRSEYADFIYEPTRPHGEVLKLMASCDVLCLPSIVEGRALVQQEAMACGVPVIATLNAGASDLVIDGVSGFLVPIRSPVIVAEKLSWMADHPEATRTMGLTAQTMARQVTWVRYGEKILRAMPDQQGNGR